MPNALHAVTALCSDPEGATSAIQAGILNLTAQTLERGPGQTIVTMLCDSGAKYQSRIFSPQWLEANGLRVDLSVDTLLA